MTKFSRTFRSSKAAYSMPEYVMQVFAKPAQLLHLLMRGYLYVSSAAFRSRLSKLLMMSKLMPRFWLHISIPGWVVLLTVVFASYIENYLKPFQVWRYFKVSLIMNTLRR